jgi:sirohydrochlorin ferrochelatase
LTLLPKAIALRKEFIYRIPWDTIVFDLISGPGRRAGAPCEPGRGARLNGNISMASTFSAPHCLLFDNGSLRPEATLNLRRIAARLQAAIEVEVLAASLLHSCAIPAGELDGVPARLVEVALEDLLAKGADEVVLVPLFFGPSAALTDYLPRRLGRLRGKYGNRRVHLARWLVDPGAGSDFRIASILARRVRAVIAERALSTPHVVLVDHGSPQRAVVEVRDFLAGQLRTLLGNEVGLLVAASMERRAGPEYDFCDPLLSAVLRSPEFRAREVVVAQQFLSPGRHAGPGGDVAAICRSAGLECANLKIYPTELMGADPLLIPVLSDRYREARVGEDDLAWGQ